MKLHLQNARRRQWGGEGKMRLQNASLWRREKEGKDNFVFSPVY
jgi:hypothetical protein